jgi:hypothetical protein
MNTLCDSITASPTVPSGHLVALKRGVLVILFAVFIAILPGPALAEVSEQEQLPGKLMIRGGWAYVFDANTTVAFPGQVTGVGTSIDFAKTLGGDTSTDALRIEALYRFNERHSLGFSWYRIGLAGQKSLNEQIQIEDQTINVGASVSTSLNLNLYRLLYNYSFYRNEKVELAVSPGLYMANTKFMLSAQGTINGTAGASTTIDEQLTLPLPSIGGVVNYNITPRLQSQIRGDFFYLHVGDFEGSMFEFYAGLEYRLFKNFALGAAYDRLVVDVADQSSGGFNVNLGYNLLYLYGSIYLF